MAQYVTEDWSFAVKRLHILFRERFGFQIFGFKNGVGGVNKTFEHPVIPISTFFSPHNITPFNKEI
jgi:hypothetical protein